MTKTVSTVSLLHFQKAHKALKNKEKSAAQSAYMRNQFAFYGISKPERHAATTPLIRQFASKEKALEMVELLWALEEREYQYTALQILKAYEKKLEPQDAELLERLIIDKSWWDTVDTLAPLYGALAKRYPELYTKFDNYIQHENFWLNRTAIIHQLYYQKDINAPRLFGYIEKHLNTKEFFVQKAIGWSLRQYAKYYPMETIAFVEKTALSRLATSQAYRHLKKDKKYQALIKK